MILQAYQTPTAFKHGLGALSRLADEAKALGLKRPLFVTDKGLVATGMVDEALNVLKAGGVDFVRFDEVIPNPPVALVDHGAAIYRQEGCDGMIGFGGGSSMDAAKAIGVVARHGGSALAYEWADPNPVARPIPPLIAVPTTAGTGSEATLWAVITDPERHIKFNIGGTPNIAATVALIDPLLTLNLPGHVTAGTGMDALAHAVECYTMAYAQPFTDAVALLAMEYVGQYLRVAFAQGHNQEARYKMSMAAMLGGLAYGTDSAGAAHAMSQTAGGVVDCPHGALTARLLGPVMEYNYLGEPQRFARMAQALGEDTRGLSVWQAAEKAVEAVYRLTEDVEIPTLQQLGFTENQIPLLAEIAAKDPQTIGNPRDVNYNGYVKIYRRAFELGR
ncbi:MAG: iron-containing alcohol dehydrogenase [Caldilineales bacterium]|nr:iron-containing alcohol dehydrogenase [Caldilineales bacterium]MCW5859621.1 iron-containing alcohol dehydrogenase [Caldilineales bacterium]